MESSGKNVRAISHDGGVRSSGDFFVPPIHDLEDIAVMAAHACGVSTTPIRSR